MITGQPGSRTRTANRMLKTDLCRYGATGYQEAAQKSSVALPTQYWQRPEGKRRLSDPIPHLTGRL